MHDIKNRSATGVLPEPRPFFVRARFRDIDEIGHIARDWDIDFRQVGAGPVDGDLVQWASESVQLARVRLRGRIHQRGNTPPDLRTFAIPANREIRLFWRGHDIGRDQIMVFPRRGELESASRPDFDMLTISVTEESLDDAAHRLGLRSLDGCLAGREVVSCDSDLLARARRSLCRALADPSGPGSVAAPDRVAETLMRLVASSTRAPQDDRTSSGPPPPGRTRDVAIGRALEFIARDLAAPYRVETLARVAGCSERTLRRAFRSRFDVGPKTYLLAWRLAGARRELRGSDPDTTRVADIANRWGFWHMGQFAADFRRFYGELPSDALGR